MIHGAAPCEFRPLWRLLHELPPQERPRAARYVLAHSPPRWAEDPLQALEDGQELGLEDEALHRWALEVAAFALWMYADRMDREIAQEDDEARPPDFLDELHHRCAHEVSLKQRWLQKEIDEETLRRQATLGGDRWSSVRQPLLQSRAELLNELMKPDGRQAALGVARLTSHWMGLRPAEVEGRVQGYVSELQERWSHINARRRPEAGPAARLFQGLAVVGWVGGELMDAGRSALQFRRELEEKAREQRAQLGTWFARFALEQMAAG